MLNGLLSLSALPLVVLSIPNVESGFAPQRIRLANDVASPSTAPAILTDGNIKAGDPAYPALNPHPTRTVALKGSLPTTLHIRFLVSYKSGVLATDRSHWQDCSYVVPSSPGGESQAFTLKEPLPISRSGTQFQAAIPVDKYLPGRCEWHFDGIGFAVVDGVGPLAEGWFASAYDFQRDQSNLGDLYEGRVDIWCLKQPYPPDPRRPEQCASFPIIQTLLPISSAVVSRIPEGERKSNPRVWIFPSTRVVEIHFHDLDAMQRTRGVTR